MDVQLIALSNLHAHPANANVMPEDRLAKLRDHIRRTDRYPPIIVRPWSASASCPPGADSPGASGDDASPADGSDPGALAVDHAPPVLDSEVPFSQYQIIDGHHRCQALSQLGREQARCVVWEVDDDEALVLLATLNRLQGQDDAHRRADLLEQLRHRFDLSELAQRLPENLEQIEQSLKLHGQPPQPRAPRVVDQMPSAVHFFLLPEQRKQLERLLKQLDPSREAALMTLVQMGEQTLKGPAEHGETDQDQAKSTDP